MISEQQRIPDVVFTDRSKEYCLTSGLSTLILEGGGVMLNIENPTLTVTVLTISTGPSAQDQ